ncbi:hypothetical protein GF323_04960 [Candidatus Woesearchaeota archaeon]|nr:hypothetical protein [Candidatus Woesearchaeota archaeon]
MANAGNARQGLIKKTLRELKKIGYKDFIEEINSRNYIKTRKGWCIFLKKPGSRYSCEIYGSRPEICRRYPEEALQTAGQERIHSTNTWRKSMNKTKKIEKMLDILKKERSKTMLGEMSKNYSPYQILIAAILSARSRDEVTYPLCEKLFKKYPTAESLSKANPKEVNLLIRRIGFHNQKSRYIIGAAKKIIENSGKIPAATEELIKLPGVGRKVAGCVMVYAHKKDAIPVDTHVHKIANRTGLVSTKTPLKTETELIKITPKKYWQLVNELFVWHGKTICGPRPLCYNCSIMGLCSYRHKTLKS